MRAAVHNNFRELCEVSQHESEKELSKKSITDSETGVVKIIDAINNHTNPFSIIWNKKTPLKNIVSGYVVKDEHKSDILNAKSIGKEAAQQYIRERLVERTIPYWDPVKKLKLYTFSTGNKPLKISRKNEASITFKYHQDLFSRLITVSTSRQIDLKVVLSHELAAVPLSLFHTTGEMRKTNKSQLLKELEMQPSTINTLKSHPKETSASVIDFMAVVQSISKSGLATFEDLANRFESSIFSGFQESNFVVLVPDRYDIELSIKSDERSRRQKSMTNEIEISRDSQKLPNILATYLGNSKNKMTLVNYVFSRWRKHIPEKLSPCQHVILANMDGTCVELCETGCTELDWECDHEEADSKMFVYCKYLATRYELSRIIISSPDTDVAVICCYQHVTSLSSLTELWFKTGVGNNKRYIAIHETTNTLGTTICKLLPAFHSITGCDSVRSFCGVGKKSAFAVLKAHLDDVTDMLDFGDTPELSLEQDSVVACIRFVCMLYDTHSNVLDINCLRHILFTQKNVSGERLPPTLDALTLHLRRANYQCFIWKSACKPLLCLPEPISNGWIKLGDSLDQEKMINSAVPDVIVELTRCKCTKGCINNVCSCRKANLFCSDACLCNDKDEWKNHENLLDATSSDEDD